jgi:hypothetical protein
MRGVFANGAASFFPSPLEGEVGTRSVPGGGGFFERLFPELTPHPTLPLKGGGLRQPRVLSP